MSDEYDENGISAHGAYAGPDDAPLLRDNLKDVPDPMRSLILSRLDFGEKKYGKALRMGWDKASVAALEEALDGFAYARLAGNEKAAEYFRLAFESLGNGFSTNPGATMTDSAVDGPIYEAGRLEGHADIAARLRAILDPEDENHWNIDGVLEAVEDNAKMLEAMRKELNALCDWGDESFIHAYCHIGNVVKNLRADVRVEKILREKAEANYAFRVKKAADKNLDGYRELGARAASAENEVDRLRARLRSTAQVLIEAVGADGPMDAEDAARKAVDRMDTLRNLADEKAAEAGLYAHRMEQAQKARGGVRSRLVEEGWVGPDKWCYCPYCGVEAPRPGLHKQGCPAHDKGGDHDD